ncbi:MAG: ABC transporter permease [Deltaproteobacteria bacterium]|nr:ABC transporter permease [Deltaproteobacteria bacterium]
MEIFKIQIIRFFLEPFLLILTHRRLLVNITYNEIRSRVAGSVLGLLWLVLYPILLLSAYAFVYIYVFSIRFPIFTTNEYIALIFCGLIPFIAFADSLSNGIGAVTNNVSLIKNVIFPIELIPVKTVIVSQITQIVGITLLIIASAFFKRISIFLLMLPIIWILQIMFTIGVIWVVSSLNVFVRDLQQVINVLILVLMLISPIAYTPEMVPEGMRPLLRINPLFYIITGVQDSIIIGRLTEPYLIIAFLFIAFFFFVFGYHFFIRLKRVFADNV